MKTLKELAADALSVQNTSNPLGVSKGYAQALSDLNAALKEEGLDNSTYALANHSVNRMWVSKLADMAGMSFDDDGEKLINAINECQNLAQPELVNAPFPICNNCKSGQKKKATKRVWCPTWIGSEKGPIDVCAEHAANFTPEGNPHGRGGSFHWGEEADKAFKSVVQNFPRSHDNYENAKGMAENGTVVGEKTYIVDGWAWLVASYNVLNLGSWPEVKEVFPKLFSK